MADPMLDELHRLAAEFRRRAAEHRRKAEELEHAAANLESQAARLESDGGLPLRPMSSTVAGMDLGRNEESRALKISRGRTKGRTVAPELRALQAAGLTPSTAAEICGTTRDVLKQAWGHGKQHRPMRPEWSAKLAKHGVPESTWRKS